MSDSSTSPRRGSKLWNLLLVIPFVALLWVPFYNSIEPTISGIPFFYWYQFLLVFGAGAIGFFALPYTIIVYPLVFLILPRMWSVAHKHNYITAGDFVEGRFGNKWLALAVAITGLVATMPYIALQLVGIQVVIGAMGIGTVGFIGDLPLII